MILTLLGRISQAETIDETWALASGHFASLGFARQNYGLTRFRTGTFLGAPEDAIYLSTADEAYTRIYFNGGHYARTPIFRWITQNVGATTWAWVDEDLAAGRLSPSEVEAVELNRRLGVRAGVAISFPEQHQRIKGALGLIADPGMTHTDVDRIWGEKSEEIMAVAQLMHLKIASLPSRLPARALTARQREALEWIADGKTLQDAALLMSVSVATVEKHLRLAREGLGVDTTAQAVAKGTLLNMIFQRPAPD